MYLIYYKIHLIYYKQLTLHSDTIHVKFMSFRRVYYLYLYFKFIGIERLLLKEY